MDPHSAFELAGTLATGGWALLLMALFWPRLRHFADGAARYFIPALLGLAYVVLISQGWNKTPGAGFGSLVQVRTFFSNDSLLAAGWLHYLAFDLFVGSWIATDGISRSVPRLLIAPCLGVTFLFGPVGLLLYLALRSVRWSAAPNRLEAVK
jgi:Domain of unknown function (DUF4281)